MAKLKEKNKIDLYKGVILLYYRNLFWQETLTYIFHSFLCCIRNCVWDTFIPSHIYHKVINLSILFLLLYFTGNTVSDLQQARVRIISNDVCNAPTSYNGAVRPGMLCAGLPQGGVDACRVSSWQYYHIIIQVCKYLLACDTVIGIEVT